MKKENANNSPSQYLADEQNLNGNFFNLYCHRVNGIENKAGLIQQRLQLRHSANNVANNSVDPFDVFNNMGMKLDRLKNGHCEDYSVKNNSEHCVSKVLL